MGDKGLSVLRKYEEEYWQTIAKGKEFLPQGVLPDFITRVQRVVIYDCTDGYLVLCYGERGENEFITIRRSSTTWEVLLHQQKLYDQHGKENTQRLTLQMKEPAKFEGYAVFIGGPAIVRGNLVLRPKWLLATIVVGEPREDILNGDEAAEKDIRAFLSAANLGVPIAPDTDDRVIKTLESLLAQYRQCLAEAKDEEDLQKFLKQNHFILNPWGTIHPKYKLGKEYVCDFLIEDKTAPDFKYVLVEIEPATTELFLRSQKRHTEFTALVHHALNQLRDWENWIRSNIDYVRRDFPELDQAGFMLVIGRSANLSQAQKKVIADENARVRNRTILTYDDLASRLEGMIYKLRKLVAITA